MKEINQAVVKKIARLANLELSNEETVQYSGQLESILEYIHTLNALNTAGISQTAHVMPIHNVWRPDIVKPGLDREDALAAAPDSLEGCFRVPRIIESSQ